MKIALDWIAEYLTRPVAPAESENALINAGLPLESNETVFSPGGGSAQVLDVEVTSNRSDCLSHVGLARELAALLPDVSFRPPQTAARPLGPDIQSLTPPFSVAVEDPQGCPYYSARLIQNVKVGPSPDWLVRRLESLGLRSVNNIVDITNYVLMELGQPLHAFDADTLLGRKIIVRRARKDEKIVAIDGKTYTLDPATLVIADAQNPVAVAGVMGGKSTEVSESTTTIFLESARFDPVTIRTQARALALKSDSSFRFERGIDPQAAEAASLRAAQLIVQLAGGTLCSGVLRVGTPEKPPLQVALRVARIPAVLGITVPLDRAMAILTSLGFNPQLIGSESIQCTVPSHRLDIDREIDLIEEVARVYGYANIPTLDRVNHPVQPEPVEEKARRVILQTLAATGFNEVLTVTFIRREEAKHFLPSSDASLIGVTNSDWKLDALRPSLFPSLLQVRRTNQNVGIPDARLFEHAENFWQIGNAEANTPTQHRILALVGNDVSELRAALDTLIHRLNADAVLEARPIADASENPWYSPGIAAALHLTLPGKSGEKSVRIGSLGQFTPETQKRYDLRHPVAGAEVFWDVLLESFQPVRTAKPLPTFPGIRRDLSVVLEESIRWADLASTLKSASLPFLESIDFVGTFRNKQIGTSKKSLTLTLEFRDPSTTLRSEQVDTQMKSALDLLADKFQATLRA